MRHVHVHRQQWLYHLEMENVTLSGCEASLCEAVTHLISLQNLHLYSLSLSGYQKKLCEAFIGLPRLQKLSLNGTDMTPARGVLLNCLSSINYLVYLDLADTKLTDDMTRAVVGLIINRNKDLILPEGLLKPLQSVAIIIYYLKFSFPMSRIVLIICYCIYIYITNAHTHLKKY